jgi:hypothetical protein
MLYFMAKSRDAAIQDEATRDLMQAMIAVMTIYRPALLSAWAQHVEQVQDEYIQSAMQHYYDHAVELGLDQAALAAIEIDLREDVAEIEVELEGDDDLRIRLAEAIRATQPATAHLTHPALSQRHSWPARPTSPVGWGPAPVERSVKRTKIKRQETHDHQTKHAKRSA